MNKFPTFWKGSQMYDGIRNVFANITGGDKDTTRAFDSIEHKRMVMILGHKNSIKERRAKRLAHKQRMYNAKHS